jgi:beta-galactosidase
MAHILPHWNWPERADQITPVHVFTSGDEAELFLNGKSLGRKKKQKFQYRIVWDDVVYQPGSLTVKTWKNGKSWAQGERSTTDKASKLLVTADRPQIKADGKDLSYITITIADDKDRLVPQSMNRLHFKVDGNAEIAGICNGDPTSLESMQGNNLPAFNGLCQVILRSKPGAPGAATLTVTSDGLPAASVKIVTK